jgi:NDP-sugar pyrophosphorylase family protein
MFYGQIAVNGRSSRLTGCLQARQPAEGDGRIGTAFVLGAGLGKRLRPLTLVRPKPLIPIFGRPLITFALDHLCAAGVESFVINTHHLPGQFDDLFAEQTYSGRSVKLVHEPDLLETGGGIKNAEPWIGQEPFIVYSSDVLTDFDLESLIEEHFRSGNDVTLALRDTGLAAGLTLSADGRVIGVETRNDKPGGYDFANVSVWNPEIFSKIPTGIKISFVPILVDWIGKNGKVGGVVLNDQEWFNIGSRGYLAVHRAIIERSWKAGLSENGRLAGQSRAQRSCRNHRAFFRLLRCWCRLCCRKRSGH